MRAFVSHCLGGCEELCSRLERVETNLATARKVVAEGAEALKLPKREKEAFRVEVDKPKNESEAAKAKLKVVKQENSQLKRGIEELYVGFAAQRKEIEELQTRFADQKNELEVRFIT